MDATCPNCGSARTKSCIVVHEAGTRQSERTGSFLGVGSRSGLFGGITASSGQSQSLMAKRAAPKIGALPVLMLIIALISLIFKQYAFAAFIFLLSIPTYLATARRLARYEAEWMCLRCGQTFEPRELEHNLSTPDPTTRINSSIAELQENPPTEKQCSICGETKNTSEFAYGNRENRSYCATCNSAEKAAYSSGGTEAARKFRDSKRASWRKT